MEIIEKQVEKVKEVPYGYGCYDGYGRNVVGKANAGLALGIVGTVLGGAALFGNRRSGFFGTGANGEGANIEHLVVMLVMEVWLLLHSKHGKKSVRIR